MRQGPYTPLELRAIFTMAQLLLDLAEMDNPPKINKRAMLRTLMAGPCSIRSRGSLEAKLMNVSGASTIAGGPIIPGYKPAPNCQRIMIDIARSMFIQGSTEFYDDDLYQTLDPREEGGAA